MRFCPHSTCGLMTQTHGRVPQLARQQGGTSPHFCRSKLNASMKKVLITLLFATALYACTTYSEHDATRVCGVPVKGTPWELAATVADHGDGTFVPESVEVFSGKAYIRGWYNSNVTAQPYTAERSNPYLLQGTCRNPKRHLVRRWRFQSCRGLCWGGRLGFLLLRHRGRVRSPLWVTRLKKI